MTFSIDRKMINSGEKDFFTSEWLKTVEDHLSFLINLSSTKTIIVDNNVALRFEFDFQNLLLFYNYPFKYHYVILRANGMNSFSDYKKELINLIIPSGDSIDNVFRIYKAYYKKLN